MERIFIIGLTVLLILTLGILVLNAKLYPAKDKMVSVSPSIVSFVILIIIFEQILWGKIGYDCNLWTTIDHKGL